MKADDKNGFFGWKATGGPNFSPGLRMTHGQQPVPAPSPAQMKKKEAWAGDEKPAQRQPAWADVTRTKL